MRKRCHCIYKTITRGNANSAVQCSAVWQSGSASAVQSWQCGSVQCSARQCSLVVLFFIQRMYAKARRKAPTNHRKRFPDPSKTVPRPSKIETRAVHDSKDAPKMPPRALQERSKGTQSRPRTAQKRPRGAQELPKGRQGGSQTRPKSSPGTYSKRFLLQVLLAGLAEQSEIDLLFILRCFAKAPKAIFLHTRGVL